MKTEFVCQCGKRVGCSPICRECQAEMGAYLKTFSQTTPCAMCQKGRAYPPATLCGACVAYIADCEAELGAER